MRVWLKDICLLCPLATDQSYISVICWTEIVTMKVTSSTLLLLLPILLPLPHPLHWAEAEDQNENHNLKNQEIIFWMFVNFTQILHSLIITTQVQTRELSVLFGPIQGPAWFIALGPKGPRPEVPVGLKWPRMARRAQKFPKLIFFVWIVFTIVHSIVITTCWGRNCVTNQEKPHADSLRLRWGLPSLRRTFFLLRVNQPAHIAWPRVFFMDFKHNRFCILLFTLRASLSLSSSYDCNFSYSAVHWG